MWIQIPIGIGPGLEFSQKFPDPSRSNFLPNPDFQIPDFMILSGSGSCSCPTHNVLLSQISVVMDLWSWSCFVKIFFGTPKSRPAFWNCIFLKKAKGFFCRASEFWAPLSPKQTSQNQKCHFFKVPLWFYSISKCRTIRTYQNFAVT